MNRSLLLTTALLVTLGACSKSNKQVGPEQKEITATPGSARKVETTSEFMARFYANPALVMDETPVKTNSKGEVVSKTAFTEEEIQNNEFVAKRDAVRARLMGINPSSDRAVISEDYSDENGYLVTDKAENLVDGGYSLVRDVFTMERRNLKSATLAEQPWSDDYWAIKNGILGHRYADENVPTWGSWKDVFDYAQDNSVNSLIVAGQVDKLSPSEKYDLLVGDSKGTLTSAMWSEGRGYFESKGEVEAWMGICHGWAPAAYMLPRPTQAITVKSFDGKQNITFFPSDIKALGSLLWAKAAAPTRFIGGRCNSKDPKKDSQGRVTERKCFDNNPGSWHMSVVNQIGVSKRSMVLDATYDYEVWNQPILGYSFTYFNPESGTTSDKLAESMVAPAQFTKDVFKSYRSPLAKSIVGIEMTLKYIVETSPTQNLTNAAAEDAIHTVVYRYDLELDGQGKIIGGEWYSNAHPDFLWTPGKGAKANSQYDSYVKGNWKALERPVHRDWAHVASYASKEGIPLAKIVEILFETSAEQGRLNPTAPVVEDKPLF